MNLTSATILAERLARHRLTKPLRTRREFLPLFKELQPVSPIHFSYPGSPPGLVHRTAFDAIAAADRLRPNRTLVKGRFLGGAIGYVCADDLPIYARAFQKPIKSLNYIQRTVLDIVREIGPLSPRQIKEESQLIEDPGFLNKEIMPALHRLQEAFLVFEDQPDDDWERNWRDFSAEWPDIDLDAQSWEDAASEVFRRFIQTHVFATRENIRDWSRLPLKAITLLMAKMEKQGDLVSVSISDLGEGWLAPDATTLKTENIPPSVFMLHKADPLVKSHASELKRRFGDHEVLQYLLIDGLFQGAVLGHWRIGPHDVDDILLELPAKACATRKADILNAVAHRYQPPNHNILCYNGKSL